MLKFISLSTKLTITASLSIIAVTFVSISTGRSAIAGTLSDLSMGLLITGLSAWGVAALQGLYLTTKTKHREIKIKSNVLHDSNNQDALKLSTHAKINSILNITSSSAFLVNSAVLLSRPTLPIITRTLGSFYWLQSSIFAYMLAHQKNKNADVSILGINEHTCNIIISTDFLSAGILFATATYTEELLDPFAVISTSCWMLSGLLNMEVAIFNQNNNGIQTTNVVVPPPTIKIEEVPESIIKVRMN